MTALKSASTSFSESSSSSRTGEAATANYPELDALSTRMKGALQTTDQLADFWRRRGAIELEYATKLASLAEDPFGKDEPSEVRKAIDSFRVETARRAMCHHKLSTQIAIDLESRCIGFQKTQQRRWRDVHQPAAKALVETSSPSPESPLGDTGISREWRRDYRNMRRSLDVQRLEVMMSGNRNLSSDSESGPSILDHANAKRKIWKKLRDSCQDLETERSLFFKGMLASFADVVESIREADVNSCKFMKSGMDLYDPEEVVEDFNHNIRCDMKLPEATQKSRQPPLPSHTVSSDFERPMAKARPQSSYSERPLPNLPQGVQAETPVVPILRLPSTKHTATNHRHSTSTLSFRTTGSSDQGLRLVIPPHPFHPRPTSQLARSESRRSLQPKPPTAWHPYIDRAS